MGAKRSVILFAILMLAAGLLADGCKSKPQICAVCNRQIHRQFQATLLAHGKRETTCCIACSMHYQMSDREGTIETVTDYRSGKPLTPSTAVYLFGSDIHTCGDTPEAVRTGDSGALFVQYDRCEPAVIAFRTFQDAQSVQKEHGGRIVSFPELHSLF